MEHTTSPWSGLGLGLRLGLRARAGTGGTSYEIPRYRERMGWEDIPDLGLVGCLMGSQDILWQSQTILVEQCLQLPFQLSFEVCRTVHANTLNMNKAVKMSKTMLVFSAFEDISGLELHNNAQHSSHSVRDDHKGNKVACQRRFRVVER